MDVHKTLYPFYTNNKVLHLTPTVSKMHFVGSSCKVYCDTFHNRLSVDFSSRYFFTKKQIAMALTKEVYLERLVSIT